MRTIAIILTLILGATARATEKPNVVIIYADDMGYGDCTVYNAESKVPTPNIDRLAKFGMRFTNAHSPGATCTASRYGLLTGISPVRTGVLNGTTKTGPAIDAKETTIAQMLKDQGYKTNMIGKWHLGFDIPKGRTNKNLTGTITGGPLDRGFDYFHGNESSGPSSHPIIGREKVSKPVDENLQNRQICNDVIRIIMEHGASDQSKPLFLHYALVEPHAPQIPEKEFQGKSDAGAYGDYIVQLDHWVGKILDTLKETGLEQNTLVLFASDNGASKRNMATCPGHKANGVLAGYKASPLEGGHRVPLIVKWPGKIPASTVSHALVSHTDFFATFTELLNVDLSKYPDSAKDSYSFLPVLKNPSAQHNRPPMAVIKSFRKGSWKIIVDDYKGKADSVNVVALCNLAEDLSEKTNLLKTNPEKAEALLGEYRQYLANRELKSAAAKPKKERQPKRKN